MPQTHGVYSFDAWMHYIDKYVGNDLLWLNGKGELPNAAEIIKGEHRVNPFKERRRFDTTVFPEEKIAQMRMKLLEEDANMDQEAEAEGGTALDEKELAEMEE